MNEQKLCESAYLTGSEPIAGPRLHAAGMIDRSEGTPQFYLVRGTCSDSVVTELHRQLVQSGRLPRSSSRRATASSSLLLVTAAAVVIGLLATLLRSIPR